MSNFLRAIRPALVLVTFAVIVAMLPEPWALVVMVSFCVLAIVFTGVLVMLAIKNISERRVNMAGNLSTVEASGQEIRYKMASGELVGGEFTYVGGLEWFDDDWEPADLIRETIEVVSSERVTYVPRGATMLCSTCGGEEELADGTTCPHCDGAGTEPEPLTNPYPTETTDG